ncbi:MAG: hypothetical protein Q9219_004900 [cf. Caloplaca sp. 3 TL-2023]
MFEDIYFTMGLILGPFGMVVQEAMSPDFEKHTLKFHRLAFSVEMLGWVTIFAVKMSFLLFFRQLLDRLKDLLNFWKVTVGIVVVSAIYCVGSVVISCPYLGSDSVECTEGSGLKRTIDVVQIANAVNMLTDLLIVAVPVCLLWRVKIRLGQKIILGTFLCVSVCMLSVCLVRTVGLTIEGTTGTTVDVQWDVFWLLTEASVAVTAVSLTAFRSLYGMRTCQQQDKDKKRYQWLASYKKRMLDRKKQCRVDEFGDPISDEENSLPSIPSATLSGLRSIIGRMTVWSTQALSTRGGTVYVEETQKEEERAENDIDVTVKSEV